MSASEPHPYRLFVRASFCTERINDVNISMGLASEVGEVLDLVRKGTFVTHGYADREALELELGDVLFYLTALADAYDLSLEDLAKSNMEKLLERRALLLKANPP